MGDSMDDRWAHLLADLMDDDLELYLDDPLVCHLVDRWAEIRKAVLTELTR